MDNLQELIKYILDLEDLGLLDSDLYIILVLFGILSSLSVLVYKLWKLLIEHIKLKRTIIDIPYLTKSEIQRAMKHYVQTNCQSVSPSITSEPGQTHSFVPKERSIPFFINKVFNDSKSDSKYFLILADSGMGKTTFLINLLIQYRQNQSSWLNSISFNAKEYKIKFIPLGHKNPIGEINKIDEDSRGSTILLLDAFDEDTNAIANYKSRLAEILEATEKFREIIITCRTQFFPSQLEEPHNTGLMRYGGNKGFHLFKKLYISPFDDNDIMRYINNKYPIYKQRQRRLAKEVIEKSPSLIVRPMLLSYIDDFLDESQQFRFTYQVYQILIEKWIDRETSRNKNNTKFKSELYRFSRDIAVNIYQNRNLRGGLVIDLLGMTKLASDNNIELTQIEMTSQSLLNRDAEGMFKFSHRSILEYFLAIEALDNGNFLSSFIFDGMENVKLFLGELGISKYLLEFNTLNPNFRLKYCTSGGLMGDCTLSELTLKAIENVYYIKFDESYFNASNIRQVILTFSSLRLFSSTKIGMIDFHYYYREICEMLDRKDYRKGGKHWLLARKEELEDEFKSFEDFEAKLREYLTSSA